MRNVVALLCRDFKRSRPAEWRDLGDRGREMARFVIGLRERDAVESLRVKAAYEWLKAGRPVKP